MPSATRETDSCTGHAGFNPRPSVSSSPDVRINNRGSVRVGDSYTTHTDGNSTHKGVLAAGSGSVRVNGRSAGRTGDALDCGSSVAAGSGDVRFGG